MNDNDFAEKTDDLKSNIKIQYLLNTNNTLLIQVSDDTNAIEL